MKHTAYYYTKVKDYFQIIDSRPSVSGILTMLNLTPYFQSDGLVFSVLYDITLLTDYSSESLQIKRCVSLSLTEEFLAKKSLRTPIHDAEQNSKPMTCLGTQQNRIGD